mmetsp:Transcript_10087/g.21808  ORF Transcript_10087/g.21808 Transcript_10087/m.21808 type:complete len:85 (+) Transcript_10087:1082-1336(+)
MGAFQMLEDGVCGLQSMRVALGCKPPTTLDLCILEDVDEEGGDEADKDEVDKRLHAAVEKFKSLLEGEEEEEGMSAQHSIRRAT